MLLFRCYNLFACWLQLLTPLDWAIKLTENEASRIENCYRSTTALPTWDLTSLFTSSKVLAVTKNHLKDNSTLRNRQGSVTSYC